MVQTMAKFMEQRDNFVVRKQGRLVRQRLAEITGQVGDRLLQAAVRFAHFINAIVHPRTTALMLARVEVQIETAAQFTAFIKYVKEADIRMVDLNALALFNVDAVDTFYDFKQAF